MYGLLLEKRLLLKAALITALEVFSRGSVSVCLISFAALYSVADYSRLLPLVACQQLIAVLAPFGSLDLMPKLMSALQDRERLYRYIPRYVLLNTTWAAPLSWLLLWLSGRSGLPTVLESLLVVTAGCWIAAQRSRQAMHLFAGLTHRYARARVYQGGVHAAIACGLALFKAPPMIAYFAGQLVGLAAAEGYDRAQRTPPSVERPSPASPPMYWVITRLTWVFGAWAIFGWFSGYGATVVLSLFTPASGIAVYGQAIAVLSLLQLCLGGFGTAILTRLHSRQTGWRLQIQKKVDVAYDMAWLAVGILALVANSLRLERWQPLVRAGLVWPDYIWLYIFLTFSALTVYQRSMLRFQLDSKCSMPITTVLSGEFLGVGIFALALALAPSRPLYGNTALIAARGMAVYLGSGHCKNGGYLRGLTSVAGIVLLSFCLAVVRWPL